MSRKYLNDRWCVRCGRKTPCPYLAKNVKLFEQELNKNGEKLGCIVDCGCGNGRNTKYLQSLGYNNILSLDMAGDFGIKCVLGKNKIPTKNRSISLILCNYIFMFLNEKERSFLSKEINRIADDGCYLMIELYPALDSYLKTENEAVDFQEKLFNGFCSTGWSKIRYSKQRFIIRKEKNENL